MDYDSKCEDLARHFLSDYDNKPEDIAELAEAIQDAVEDWLDARESAAALDKWIASRARKDQP